MIYLLEVSDSMCYVDKEHNQWVGYHIHSAGMRLKLVHCSKKHLCAGNPFVLTDN